MDWYTWVFDNPRRAAWCIAGFFLVLIVGIVSVLGYRVHQLSHTLATRPAAAATLPAALPLVTAPVTPSVNPLVATATPNVPGTAPAFTYPAAGDPLPVAIDAANYWIGSDFSHLEGVCAPSAYEDLSANPAPKGLEINGTATTTKPGPTAAEVDVPTNGTGGDLLVDLVVSGGKWQVTGMGWSTTQ